MNHGSSLDKLLAADPADVGCDRSAYGFLVPVSHASGEFAIQPVLPPCCQRTRRLAGAMSSKGQPCVGWSSRAHRRVSVSYGKGQESKGKEAMTLDLRMSAN